MSAHEELRNRIDEQWATLSLVGRRVALLLLDEHDRIGFHSATDLGRMSGTSDATVIRTVQRLGYRGIIDFKAAVAASLVPATPRERLAATIGDASTDAQLEDSALARAQAGALRGLGSREICFAVDRAAAIVAGARRVTVHAHGVSHGLAQHAAAQLARIGCDARVLGSAAGVTGDDVQQLREGDTVIALTSGRRQPWHAVLFERCAVQRCGVVLITDTQPPPTPDAVVVRAGRGDDTSLATHVATIAVLERLVVAVAARDRDRTDATLDELNRQRAKLARA